MHSEEEEEEWQLITAKPYLHPTLLSWKKIFSGFSTTV
jgi:hypothetical protein